MVSCLSLTVASTPPSEKRAEEVIVVIFKGVVGKEVSKDVVGLTEIEVVEIGSSAWSIEAILVVCSAFFGVRQILVGFCDLSELLDCLFFVTWVLIGVPLNS